MRANMPRTGDRHVNKKPFRIAINLRESARFYPLDLQKIANKLELLRRYDRAPLIQPILYKTAFYWVVVFFARLFEQFVEFVREGGAPSDFILHLQTTFSWHRFFAISVWVFVLFLIYVTASEFLQLFGPAEIRRLLFASRPSELHLNRRQRARELLRLSRLTDEHAVDQFRDPGSAAHQQLVAIVERLARAPQPKP